MGQREYNSCPDRREEKKNVYIPYKQDRNILSMYFSLHSYGRVENALGRCLERSRTLVVQHHIAARPTPNFRVKSIFVFFAGC